LKGVYRLGMRQGK